MTAMSRLARPCGRPSQAVSRAAQPAGSFGPGAAIWVAPYTRRSRHGDAGLTSHCSGGGKTSATSRAKGHTRLPYARPYRKRFSSCRRDVRAAAQHCHDASSAASMFGGAGALTCTPVLALRRPRGVSPTPVDLPSAGSVTQFPGQGLLSTADAAAASQRRGCCLARALPARQTYRPPVLLPPRRLHCVSL